MGIKSLHVRRLYSLVSKMDQFKNAIRDNDTDKALELKQKFDLDLKFALFDAIKEDEKAAIDMIENSQSLTLSLSETDGEERTPLILAGDLKKPKIFKAILCQAFSKMDQFKNAIKDNDTDKALELEQEINLNLKLAFQDIA